MYLLDSQQVLDLFSRDSTRAIFQWINDTKPGEADLFVSVISLGQIAHTIDDLPPPERNHWRRLYNEGRRDFLERGGVIDVDGGIVDVWQSQLRGSRLDHIKDAAEELGEDDRLVVATAIQRGYSLVTRKSLVLQEITKITTLTLIEL
jgi:predicted nucleic acid-binding protein